MRDLVIASGACTDSSMNRIRFEGLDYAPVADFGLLRGAYDAAERRDLADRTKVGLIFSSDSFYSPRPELTSRMVEYGVLAVEMEASALYTLAAQLKAAGAGDLHGLRPHRDRRGDQRAGARADLRRHGRDRARRDAGRLTAPRPVTSATTRRENSPRCDGSASQGQTQPQVRTSQ